MDTLFLSLIHSSLALQQSVVDALLTSCLGVGGAQADPAHSTRFPPCSPGHPPLPHAPEHSDGTRAGPAALTPADGVCLPVTLDAFDVLHFSPALGEALVSSPDRTCQAALAHAIVDWIGTELRASPTSVDAPVPLGRGLAALTPVEALTLLPVSVRGALARGQLRVAVSLLVLRVPCLVTCALTGHLPGSVTTTALEVTTSGQLNTSTDLLSHVGVPWVAPWCLGARSLPVEGRPTRRGSCTPTAGQSPLTLSEVSDIPPFGEDTQSMSWHSPDTASRQPVDAFLGVAASSIHCLAVVTAVFFGARSDVLPLPTVRVRPLSVTSHEYLAEDLLVDLRALDPLSSPCPTQAVVVGCVWELHGALCSGPIPAHGVIGAAHREATGDSNRLWHYVTASVVRTAWRRGCAPTLLDDVDTPATAWEERAARASGVCWEGLRLALGVGPAPSPCDKDTVELTSFFCASLDAVVAILVVLAAARRPQESAMVSVAILDEAPTPLLSSLLKRIRVVCPSSVYPLQPPSVGGGAGRWRWQGLLPLYQTRTGSSARRASHSADDALSVVGDVAQEAIAAGALSNACGATAVVAALDCLPAAYLAALRRCCSTRSSNAGGVAGGGGGDVDAVDTVVPSNDLATGAGDSDAVITPTDRIIHRQGGQEVPYFMTHSLLVSLRGHKMLSPQLFEYLRRRDVVVRPSVSTRRRQLSLYATADERLQRSLQLGSAWWSRVAQAVFEPYPCADDVVPVLSSRCSDLLRLYFLAACAMYPSSVDSSLMESLTTLTCCHATLRLRVSRQAPRHTPTGTGPPLSPQPDETLTCLVDAAVAIGLCDSTLLVQSQKTVLTRCLFQILEAELIAAPPARGFLVNSDGERQDPDALCRQVEATTAWPAVERPEHTFSIIRFVDELEAYLRAQLPS